MIYEVASLCDHCGHQGTAPAVHIPPGWLVADFTGGQAPGDQGFVWNLCSPSCMSAVLALWESGTRPLPLGHPDNPSRPVLPGTVHDHHRHDHHRHDHPEPALPEPVLPEPVLPEPVLPEPACLCGGPASITLDTGDGQPDYACSVTCALRTLLDALADAPVRLPPTSLVVR